MDRIAGCLRGEGRGIGRQDCRACVIESVASVLAVSTDDDWMILALVILAWSVLWWFVVSGRDDGACSSPQKVASSVRFAQITYLAMIDRADHSRGNLV